MAKDDNNKGRQFDLDKKSKRSFDLDKGKKRAFDLEKDSKHTFDLAKGDEESLKPQQPANAGQQLHGGAQPGQTQTGSSDTVEAGTGSSGNNVDSGGSNGKKWIIVIILIAVIAALAVWLLFGRGGGKDGDGAQPATEQVTGQDAETEDAGKADSTDASMQGAASGNDGQQQGETVPSDDASAQGAAEEPSPAESNATPPAETVNQAADSAASVSQSDVTPQLAATLDEQARQVIRGDFGNGEERKQKLGGSYAAIQKRVNEMYREGLGI